MTDANLKDYVELVKVLNNAWNAKIAAENAANAANMAFYAAVVTALLAFCGVLVNFWSLKIKTYKEIVTAERVKCMSQLTKDTAEFIAVSHKMVRIISGAQFLEQELESTYKLDLLSDLINLSARINLSVNHSNEKTKIELDLVVDSIKEFINAPKEKRDVRRLQADSSIVEFESYMQSVLKYEWEWIKKEAR